MHLHQHIREYQEEFYLWNNFITTCHDQGKALRQYSIYMELKSSDHWKNIRWGFSLRAVIKTHNQLIPCDLVEACIYYRMIDNL